MKKTTYTLADAIALDGQRKGALDKEFSNFYKQMKDRISAKSELKDLEVPLERVREAVEAAAFGGVFGIPMVEVENPENWDEAANPNRPRPKT